MKNMRVSLVIGIVLSLYAAGFADKGIKKQSAQPKKVTAQQAEKPAAMPALANPASGEQINWQVISCGGTDGSSTNYSHTGTSGQVAAGPGRSSNYRLANGFWPDFSPTSCCVDLTGNIDGDPSDIVDLGDLTALIDYLFISFTEPDCFEEANIDGDAQGIVDLGDLTALIDYLFISFTPPAPCQ